jgi:hypothetical protein
MERTLAPGTSISVIDEQGTPVEETEDRRARIRADLERLGMLKKSWIARRVCWNRA